MSQDDGPLAGKLAEARAHLRAGRPGPSERILSALLSAHPADAGVHEALAEFHLAHGGTPAALLHLETACRLAPQSARAALALGRLHASAGRFEQARGHFRRAAELDPALFDAWFLLGITYMRDERRAEALPALRQAHRLQPANIDATRALADAEFHAGLPRAAMPLWKAVVEARPADMDARLKLGESLSRLGDLDAEIASYRDALALHPESADMWMSLAQALEDGGDKPGAIDAYVQALRLRPDWILPLSGLLALRRTEAPDALMDRAAGLLADPALDDRDAALLGYAMGKAHDSLGMHEAAMQAWHAANAARRRLAGPHDRARAEQRVAGLMRTFDRTLFAGHAGRGSADERPVFIVGMPRSGTTLTEQIIAAHSRAHGSGELPDIGLIVRGFGSDWPEVAGRLDDAALAAHAARYLESAARNAPGALRLVDKAPLNYFNLGLVALLFPRARVIWCRRDPRDIALSIYGENFALEAPFSTDLGDIAHTIELQVRLMRHWQAVLPLPILELRYEDLVASPEDQARRLLAFLDLDWEPGCLEFHRSARSVQTPSRWQVRQPIHGRSSGRWRAYATHLPTFAPACFPEGAG